MTDWNKEAELRIEYLNWRIDNNLLPCFSILRINLGATIISPAEIFKLFMRHGIMVTNATDCNTEARDEPTSFEEWTEWCKQIDEWMP